VVRCRSVCRSESGGYPELPIGRQGLGPLVHVWPRSDRHVPALVPGEERQLAKRVAVREQRAACGSRRPELQAERLASVAVAAHDGEAEERETKSGISGHTWFRLRARLGVVLLYVDRRSWHLRAHVCWDREARRW